MLEKLKEKVFEANLRLVKNGLVLYTWGNVSEHDKETGFVAIKPSGVSYESLRAQDIVIIDLNGNVVEGLFTPSSDAFTHLELYKAHPEIGGVAHTHSTFATAFAQAGMDIKPFGTTHADYFFGPVPCARALTKSQIETAYEKNTGLCLCEILNKKNALDVPAALVKNHGPFAWGADAFAAVYHATVLEEIAKMAHLTLALDPEAQEAPKHLMDKHYFRKHGKNAYYGQKEGDK